MTKKNNKKTGTGKMTTVIKWKEKEVGTVANPAAKVYWNLCHIFTKQSRHNLLDVQVVKVWKTTVTACFAFF